MKLVRRRSLRRERVSHDPRLRKLRWLERGAVPGMVQLAATTLPGGYATRSHAHADMWEVFLVLSGSGWATVDRCRVPLQAGDCLVIEPGEIHRLRARPGGRLRLLYAGLVREGDRRWR